MTGEHLVLYNGRIKTMDRTRPLVSALAIVNGRVAALGSDQEIRELVPAGTEAIDLRGRTATPGLNDAHAHPKMVGLNALLTDLRAAPGTPLRDVLQRLGNDAASKPKGSWIVGRGYDENFFAERRHPTRADLDAVAPDHPVFIYRADMHIGVANSLALQLAGISQTTPDPGAGIIDRDEQGEPTGILREEAMNPVQAAIGEPTREMLSAALLRAGEIFRSFGITSVAEAGIYTADEFQAYLGLHNAGELPLRTYLMTGLDATLDAYERLGIATGFGDEWLRLGPAKLFADGSIGGRTARFREPYLDEPDNYGLFMMPPEELKAKVLRAHRAGFQVAIHAIGNAAIDLVLDAYEAALQDTPRADHRHRIEHCSIVDEATIRRIAQIGAVPIPGTAFLYYFRDGYIKNLGYDRIRYAYGLNTYHRYGIVAAASSDAPVVPPNSGYSLFTMVTRKDLKGEVVWPEEAISLDDALRAYTVAGAYASFEEGIKGTLVPGHLGDVAIFETDLDAMPAEDLAEVKVDLTIQEGRVVWERAGISA